MRRTPHVVVVTALLATLVAGCPPVALVHGLDVASAPLRAPAEAPRTLAVGYYPAVRGAGMRDFDGREYRLGPNLPLWPVNVASLATLNVVPSVVVLSEPAGPDAEPSLVHLQGLSWLIGPCGILAIPVWSADLALGDAGRR
jgi:hypothetical protein